MRSYVYVAVGHQNTVRVMKIGKTDNPTRRGREVGLEIYTWRECTDKAAAFGVEGEMRRFIDQHGGVWVSGYDWYQYDDAILAALVDTFFWNEELSLKKTQIRKLETRAELLRQRLRDKDADTERKLSEKEELIYKLQREIGALTAKLEMAGKRE